jgi:NAD-dependent SIR2 family protein deacetylase
MSFRRNVFILGAGFSAGAGAPLISNFLDTARELYENPGSPLTESERNSFRQVFHYRFDLDIAKAKLRIDLDNIEDLFGLLDMQCQLADSKSDPVLEIRQRLLHLIVKTLECSITNPRESHIAIGARSENGSEIWDGYRADIYEHFLRLISGDLLANERRGLDGEVVLDSIITLNYDLILDHALRRLEIDPIYAVGSQLQNGGHPPQGLRKRGLCLLKLHGSANWLSCSNCPNEISISLDKVTRENSELLMGLCDQCGERTLTPLIVPPTWNKGGRHPVLKSVWRIALATLRDAQRIFIIGYSLPYSDRFFEYLLGAALSQNKNLYEIIIVNKDKSIEAKYSEVFSQSFAQRSVHYRVQTAESFISQGDLQRCMRQVGDHVPQTM